MKRRAGAPVELYDLDLPAGDGSALALCTGRGGGVSAAPYETLNLGFHVGDDPASVRENRRRVAAGLGVAAESLVVPQQVHEGAVAVAGPEERGRGALDLDSAIAATDALVSATPGLVLGVVLADCVPVIAWDPATPAIGVAHAGWRGTVRHIARRTVEAMVDAFGSDPARMSATIGPSIGPRSYEVGPEVAAEARVAFPEETPVVERQDGRLCFDLWAGNELDLLSVGLAGERIAAARVDTYESAERFFSHRRARPTGRFMALAALGLR
jgi:YfiH family protein